MDQKIRTQSIARLLLAKNRSTSKDVIRGEIINVFNKRGNQGIGK